MTIEEIFDSITKVLSPIELYNSTKSIGHYTDEDINTMILIWEQGIVKTQVSKGCSGCLKHVSDVIWSYYTREKDKYYADKEAKANKSVQDNLNDIKDVVLKKTKKVVKK